MLVAHEPFCPMPQVIMMQCIMQSVFAKIRFLSPLLNDNADAEVVDSAVLRYPKAVTHFSPGSYQSESGQTPTLTALDCVAFPCMYHMHLALLGLPQKKAISCLII